MFGNALLEEIVFRGFLFVQLFLLCGKIKHHPFRVTAAMLISQTIFALMHVPNRNYSGYAGMEFVYDFIQLVILGTVFCLLYWLTRNLFMVVGVHALVNISMLLRKSDYAQVSMLGTLLLLVILLPLIRGISRLIRKPAAKELSPKP